MQAKNCKQNSPSKWHGEERSVADIILHTALQGKKIALQNQSRKGDGLQGRFPGSNMSASLGGQLIIFLV
jgi:hypothetical protein